MRHGDWEKRGKCLHLYMEEMTPEEKKAYTGIREEKDIPTHSR
jgi:hypothetical protein